MRRMIATTINILLVLALSTILLPGCGSMDTEYVVTQNGQTYEGSIMRSDGFVTVYHKDETKTYLSPVNGPIKAKKK